MSIIPKPRFLEVIPGLCTLPEIVLISFNQPELLPASLYLKDYLETRLQASATTGTSDADASTDLVQISLHLLPESLPSLISLPNANEAYELAVREDDGITIRGLTTTGIFYGIQTILQLLPPTPPLGRTLTLPLVKVVDSPRFKWRGLLLDVGRHYMSIGFIKRLLDIMAWYKLNYFHWHLTEDQGWRLEVKQFPRLTDFGAWRGAGEDSSKYGGFYTQDQVREIVQYAAQRCIHVMPEIEMPGHCGAALASYPHLSCTGQVSSVPTQWGVHEDVYCAGKEETFQFLEGVLSEVVELFPCSYVHIGGDECPKVRWSQCPSCQQRMKEHDLKDEEELQSWFIQRMGRWLQSRGKHFVGWDEIHEGGLPEGAVLMSWRGMGGGVRAIRGGSSAIMCPTTHCYFDYKQDSGAGEPGAWYAVLPLETVYSFDPVPPPHHHYHLSRTSSSSTTTSEDSSFSASALTQEQICLIAGGQANLWTEFISDENTAEYMVLPRVAALAEGVWSRKEDKNWHDFKERLQAHCMYYKARGWRYRPLDR